MKRKPQEAKFQSGPLEAGAEAASSIGGAVLAAAAGSPLAGAIALLGTGAAKLLGINPTYLSRLIRNLGLKTDGKQASRS